MLAAALVAAFVGAAPAGVLAAGPTPAGDARQSTSTDLRAQVAAARAAAEVRDWDSALPRWRAIESAAPEDVDLLIESARVHGFADRNAEAAARYRKVLEVAPGRRGDVLLSLAWQTLWAGEPDRAVPLFLEVAQETTAFAGGGDGFDAWRGAAEAARNAGRLDEALHASRRAQALRPDDRTVARHIAQTLAWLDRHDEAVAAFAALVASDPGDRLSRYGLARARNAAGDHRAAVAEYRSAVASDRSAGRTPPPDALFDRARALRWAGYDDLAHLALEGLPQPDAKWLREFRTGRELRPWARLAFEAATDRDELDTRASVAELGWHPTAASSLQVSTRFVDLDEPTRSRHGERIEVGWRARFGAGEAAIGTAADHGPSWVGVTLEANRYGDWRPLSGAARLRWLAQDALRVDAELTREIVETPLAVANRVEVDVAALGATWRWRPRAALTGTVAALKFDDGNMRTRVNLRADYALRLRPRVVVGIDAMALRSSDPASDERPSRGYWNPRAYSEARAFVALEYEARPVDVALKLGVGVSREEDGWGNSSHGNPNLVELSASYDLGRSLRLRVWAGGSGASMGAGTGGANYWRRYAGIGLTGWF